MKFWKTLVPVFATAVLVACGGGGGGASVAPPAVATVSVSPPTATMTVGDTMKLGVALTDSSGRNVTGRTVTWGSLSSTTVSVTADGQITAMAVGQTQVTATVDSRQGTTTITVVAPAVPATVASVVIEPASVALLEGSASQFKATAYDSAGGVITGRGIHWTALEPQIAGVDGGGLITALKAGVTTVSARIDGKTATAGVRVEAHYPFGLLYSATATGATTRLYTMDIRDPAAVAMPVFSDSRSASHPAASPDGTKIAIVVLQQVGSAIYTVNRDGSSPLRLTLDDYTNDQPAWSPDGLRIAYRSRIPNGGTDIWVMDASDGGNAVNLTASHGPTNQSWPTWSPALSSNSLRIAYSHSESGNGHLWTMRPDGSDKRQVTDSTTAYDDQPNWSPVGDKIAFTRSGPGIFGDVYVVDATGGNGSLLTSVAGPLAGPQFAPAWSPDGRLIAFSSKHAGDYYQIYTVWADGTRLAQRTSDDANHETPVWLNFVN